MSVDGWAEMVERLEEELGREPTQEEIDDYAEYYEAQAELRDGDE